MEQPKSDRKSLLLQKRRPINGGYAKKGELATPEDAIALGLKSEDADAIFISHRHLNLASFHIKDSTSFPPNTAQQITDSVNERTSQVRGWILDIGTSKLVCKSFSEGSIIFADETEFMAEDWTGYTLKKCEEGTTIRIFWHESPSGGEWLHSTHRKIDCRDSRIPGVEIEIFDLFKQACPNFNYDALDEKIIYVLQIVHQENQIMNPDPIDAPYVCHLASISSASSDNPMQLLPLESQTPLEGVKYLPKLTPREACDLMTSGRFVVAQKGYEIIQIADKSMEKLMDIRGYDKTPYIPPGLMYLRLNPEDRPLLTKAVAYHLKSKVDPMVMREYVENNSRRLAHFCACALKEKLKGRSALNLTQTLKWLINQLVLKDRSTDLDQIEYAFYCLIVEISANNGVTIYRCFRDMNDMEKKFLKNYVAEPQDAIDRQSRPKNYKPRPRQNDNRAKNASNKPPTIKGNVSISYKDKNKPQNPNKRAKNKRGNGTNNGKAKDVKPKKPAVLGTEDDEEYIETKEKSNTNDSFMKILEQVAGKK